MDDLATDIKTYLKSKTPVTDLVGSGTSARIYEEEAKEGQPTPFIVFTITPMGTYTNLTSVSRLSASRVVFMAYGSTRAQSWAVAEAVRLCPIEHYRGDFGSRWMSSITAITNQHFGVDKFTKGRGGGNVLRYWVAQHFKFVHEQPSAVFAGNAEFADSFDGSFA